MEAEERFLMEELLRDNHLGHQEEDAEDNLLVDRAGEAQQLTECKVLPELAAEDKWKIEVMVLEDSQMIGAPEDSLMIEVEYKELAVLGLKDSLMIGVEYKEPVVLALEDSQMIEAGRKGPKVLALEDSLMIEEVGRKGPKLLALEDR